MGFKVGDRVRRIGNSGLNVTKGKVYEVVECVNPKISVISDKGEVDNYLNVRKFELVNITDWKSEIE